MKELNKILSGKIIVNLHDELIIINQPDAITRYLADCFSEKIYQEAFEDNVFLQEELETLIVENGWWTALEEKNLNELPNRLEQMKVDYFESYIKAGETVKLKEAIKEEEEKFSELQHKKYEFFNYTCESLQSQAYTMDVLKSCSTFVSGLPFSESDVSLHSLYSKYNAEILTDLEIREVSKSPEWRMIWNSCKTGADLFSFPACDMTAMQKTLVNWARVYDSIYESTEMPSDEVIMNNEAIDGWFTVQRRKQEDQSKENKKDSMPQTGEVFVMAKSKVEIKNVHEMNTQEGKGIIKSREKDLKQKGSLKEQDFTHVQTNLKMKANQMLSEHHKKKG
tara:strand:- start:1463 stop:2473 length:1011 start_codon:yes stop_codon:yes gene_type:complete